MTAVLALQICSASRKIHVFFEKRKLALKKPKYEFLMRQEKMAQAVDGKQLFSFRWPKSLPIWKNFTGIKNWSIWDIWGAIRAIWMVCPPLWKFPHTPMILSTYVCIHWGQIFTGPDVNVCLRAKSKNLNFQWGYHLDLGWCCVVV